MISFREKRSKPFVIEKPKEYGGERFEYWTFDELVKDYVEGKIHPLDLKNSVIIELIEFMNPIIKWFRSGLGEKILIIK